MTEVIDNWQFEGRPPANSEIIAWMGDRGACPVYEIILVDEEGSLWLKRNSRMVYHQHVKSWGLIKHPKPN